MRIIRFKSVKENDTRMNHKIIKDNIGKNIKGLNSTRIISNLRD